MSMLAGPRRKQKVINLRAKNNAWSNDTNKFGQRMLEKMGWSSGKGLGANENGIVEHVVARYKNDEKGLGFEDKNDQWTKHEDDFNALLANLSNADGDSVQLHSGISLENKSKKSKARVHYHKFTRGKDISRYSEKDLANIFGKKSFKKEEKVEETLTEDIKTTEQIFTEKGSMDDYFKRKLAALKLKNKVSLVTSDENNQNGDDYSDHVFQGFSSNNDKINTQETTQVCGFQPFSFYNSQLNFGNDNETCNGPESTENGHEDLTKSKKKRKKSKYEDIDFIENVSKVETSQKEKRKLEDNNIVLKSEEISENQPMKVKKSKKKKYEENKDSVLKDEAPKKKSKTQDNIQTELIIEDVNATENDYVPKKKKKRKHTELNN